MLDSSPYAFRTPKFSSRSYLTLEEKSLGSIALKELCVKMLCMKSFPIGELVV
jgi:hypothetical protein